MKILGILLGILLLACSHGGEVGLGASAARPRVGTQKNLMPAQSTSAELQAALEEKVEEGILSGFRGTDFADHCAEVQQFYEASGYTLAWIRNSRPTPQALQLIAVLQDAASQGLRPEDYDGPHWSGRLAKLNGLQSHLAASDEALFDVDLTASVMRYVSDLYRGRVDVQQLEYGLDNKHSDLDVAEFLRQRLIHASDVETVLAQLEPSFPAYRRTVDALKTYLKLAREDDAVPLPASAKAIKPGDRYDGVPRLVRWLRLVGDLPPDAAPSTDIFTYEGTLVEAVKHFQRRHGLETDGWIGPKTLAALNTPLSHRVLQLQLALERWRWLPRQFAQPPIIVNIPEFGLHAYNQELEPTLSMKVVVGRAYKHETPVFASEMNYVIFRPPWNVPYSIQRRELVPEIVKDPDYLLRNNYEITDRYGNVVGDGEVNDVILIELRSGKLALRQQPGPDNSLGLIKFVLPNDHDIYLHGTPAMSLFSRARRDFSHGCIRVQDPAALAAWVLRGQPEWSPKRIRAAMDGNKTVQVKLAQPLPIFILYTTAGVSQDGEVHFYDDIYKQDVALEKALAEKYPNPA